MRRLVLWLGIAAALALATAPGAVADGGPLSVVNGGSGVASPGSSLHYVTIPTRTQTLLVRFDAAAGQVDVGTVLNGFWGIPSVGAVAQGISRDGRTLVLSSGNSPYVSPSRFVVLDVPTLKTREQVTLRGNFSYDALSPDGSRLYLIQYVDGAGNGYAHYIVRAYDLRRHRLLPEQIADRTSWAKTMVGTPVTRITSADGRWVYTLYSNPSGKPFVHALDTVGATAHCISLPMHDQSRLQDVVLSLRNGDRTLALRWRNGSPWLDVATGTWRISHPQGGFPWAWTGAGIGGGLALLAAGALLLRRRRGQELRQHARQELGLA